MSKPGGNKSITEFFKAVGDNNGKKAAKKSAPAATKRAAKVVHEIIDDDEEIEQSPKRLKTTKNSTSPYFKGQVGAKPTKKEVISLESDDDFNMDEDDAFDDEDDEAFLADDLEEIAPPPPKTTRASRQAPSPKKAKPQTPKKTPTKATAAKKEIAEEEIPVVESPTKKVKNTATPKKTPVKKESTTAANTASTASSAITAEEVLAKIPNAELPEVEEGKKFNFFAKKAADASTGTGESIDIPEASPNCLSGLTMVFTGVLPRLDRDSAENLAKKYGGKVTKSISGKTSVVVIGDEAGPSKIAKIKKLNIKAIDENGFIQLLESMPVEGGGGDAAIKAKIKREEEERRVIEEAEAEELKAQQEEERKRKLLEARRQEIVKKSSSSSQDRIPEDVPRPISDSEKLWTVKYAPSTLQQLCGNKGQVQKLHTWLEQWFDNAKSGFQYGGSDGGGKFRACLISGPPGIGKTSAAHLVAKNLGFDILEKNASDVRSKSLLNANLKSVLTNTSVVGFFKHRDENVEHTKNDRKFCLIMDEVDGMSSGDHGGAGALSAFCRVTNMPMILICNDKSLPKMRTFDKVTYALPFRRPSEMEVKSRLMSIAHREKIKLDANVIGQLVQATGNDIRQMINLLSTVSKTQKSIGSTEAKDAAASWKKQTILKPFEITEKLLHGQIYLPSARHSLNDKIDLYFNDIDFTPLMIQENYLSTSPTNCTSIRNHLERVANAADDISQSDRINSLIRSSEQQWSLLPFHGVMSSVKPSSEVAGVLKQRINFAGWLGQNSKTMKYQRLLQELQYHTRLRTSTDKKELRLDYMTVLLKRMTDPLIEKQEDGIDDVMDVMDYYFLSREDWDTINELGVGGDVTAKISTKVKTTFTRKYNSTTHPVAIYKTGNSVGAGGARKQKVDYEDVIEDDTNEKEEEETEDSDKIDTKKDKLIKEVKPKRAAKAKAKPAAKPRAKAIK
ncbi:replication factor RFC1 C terminal domain-containing protein [Scheffersomyces xylosifermentans]|uniref:replication factor RFC1 C terminal domain-containing protein n=1 Tax=Scheffersomyces xylosifermentans TaxID=1304137 RepID=UPI00315D48CE